MSEIETKAVDSFTIKDADQGLVTAIVSTFNVVDRDGDVILPGAIRNGATVKLSAYAHDVITEGKPPAGIGTVRVDSARAVFEGRYFMDSDRGREAFAVVKGLGPESEWSIGFPKSVRTVPMTKEWRAQGARRLIAGLDILEVSPVFLGANALTGTVAVKDAEHAAQQDELRAIAARWVSPLERAEVTALKDRFDAICRERDQSELHRISQQWAHGSPERMRALSTPLLAERPEFAGLLKFVRERFAIPSGRVPDVRLLPRAELRRATMTGCYTAKSNTVYVASDLDTEELTRTVIHEFAHEYEERNGWLASERFAYDQEEQLYAQWLTQRQRWAA